MNFLLFGTDPKPSEQEHSVTLSDRIVPYTIKRSPRRRLSMTIDHRGLRVLGPMNLSLRQSESLILTHESWVIQKLDEWRSERLNGSWSIHGDIPLPIFGVPHAVKALHHTARRSRIEHLENMVLLYSPDPNNTARSHKSLVQWLRQEALTHFESRINELAPRMGVRISALSLSQARTRWGSCTSHGHIRLNWRLVHLPRDLVDYVIVHELAHLKEMNHSPASGRLLNLFTQRINLHVKALRGHIATLPLIELA